MSSPLGISAWRVWNQSHPQCLRPEHPQDKGVPEKGRNHEKEVAERYEYYAEKSKLA